jgi:deoxyribonuclease-4
MIFVGPAGNATQAKEPGTEGSLKWLKENGLNAQEIEFVRNIYLSPERAEAIGKLARELGIRLSVHAPYFINLASEKKSVVDASKRMILDTADRAKRLGADAIAVHIAYYAKQKEKTAEIIKHHLLEILEKLKKEKNDVKIGIETMAKPNQFAPLDEVIAFCLDIKNRQVIPYIDFAHIFCEKGSIDYAEVFEKLKPLKLDHINSHFSNMKYNAKTKKYVDIHTMIDKAPDFLPLAKEILKRNVSITIIAESKPWPDKDALKIRDIFARLGHKLR